VTIKFEVPCLKPNQVSILGTFFNRFLRNIKLLRKVSWFVDRNLEHYVGTDVVLFFENCLY